MRIALVLAASAVGWIALHSALIVWLGTHTQPQRSDVAVILGTRVLPSGVPSFWLRERLERGVELYQTGVVRNIIVSGGLGREGYEEADVMREYLMARGVPAERIIADRSGYDTFATARRAKEIMRARAFESVVIVSHYYHIPRAELAFKRFGISNISASGVVTNPRWRDGGNLLREFAAFYFYALRNYATT